MEVVEYSQEKLDKKKKMEENMYLIFFVPSKKDVCFGCCDQWMLLILFRQLDLDLVPRIDGEQVDADACSLTQLYRVHADSSKIALAEKVIVMYLLLYQGYI